MSWKMWSAFPLAEITQVIICVTCVAINVRTLDEAVLTYRRVIRSGQNHGAQIWSWVSVRNKGCFVVIQLIVLTMGVDRLNLLLHGHHPEMPARWVAYGLARTLIAVIVAATAWANMRAFQQLRDGD